MVRISKEALADGQAQSSYNETGGVVPLANERLQKREQEDFRNDPEGL